MGASKDGDDSEKHMDKKSGPLSNPGKSFFVRLAASSLRQLERLGDSNGISYAPQAMIHDRHGIEYEWTVGSVSIDTTTTRNYMEAPGAFQWSLCAR